MRAIPHLTQPLPTAIPRTLSPTPQTQPNTPVPSPQEPMGEMQYFLKPADGVVTADNIGSSVMYGTVRALLYYYYLGFLLYYVYD